MSTCTKPIRADPFHANTFPCGRKLRTPEQLEAGLCGPHLAGQRRSQQATKERKEREQRDSDRRQRAEELVVELHARGLSSARVHFDPHSRTYTGDVVLSSQDAAQVAGET